MFSADVMARAAFRCTCSAAEEASGHQAPFDSALRALFCRYTCCYGSCPCSGQCREQHSPEWCLCCEVPCHASFKTSHTMPSCSHLSCVCRHPSSLFSTTSQPAYSSHSFLDCHVIQMEHSALMKLDMHAGDMLLLLCCVRWIVQCQMHIQGDKTSLRALKAISALSMAISEEAVAACR